MSRITTELDHDDTRKEELRSSRMLRPGNAHLPDRAMHSMLWWARSTVNKIEGPESWRVQYGIWFRKFVCAHKALIWILHVGT